MTRTIKTKLIALRIEETLLNEIDKYAKTIGPKIPKWDLFGGKMNRSFAIHHLLKKALKKA